MFNSAANRARNEPTAPEPVLEIYGEGKGGPSISALVKKWPEAKCVNSKTDAELQKVRPFAEKTVEFPGFPDMTTIGDVTQFFAGQGVGFRCKKGNRDQSPNQDAMCLISVPDVFALYAVFDGHGPEGHGIAHLAKEVLVCDFLNSADMEKNPDKAMRDCFLNCQSQIETQSKFNAKTSGTTCTMVFHDFRTGALTVGNVGNSRCILAQQPEVSGHYEIEEITRDHKPNCDTERRRIEQRGGRVVYDGFVNYTVCAKDGQYPGLLISRTLGDIVAHREAGMSADPDVKTFRLCDYAAKNQKITLFLGTDGIWNFLSNKEVVHIFSGSGGSVDHGVQTLCKEVYDKSAKDEMSAICHDITAICIDFPLRNNGGARLN